MREEDLIEFLRSTIEEDAIISRIFYLFHLTYNYSIDELDNLIQYGVSEGYFSIKNLSDSEKTYESIDWCDSNTYQEVIMNNHSQYVDDLFGKKVSIPKEFTEFLKKIINESIKN
jgi:hypothetical protein